MEPVILHCDLNAFFASVACLDNPTIRDLPVAVCGSVEERHGIVLAKNPAAAACNVKTGEAIWQAKIKCPELVAVRPNYNRYREISSAAREIYGAFTDMVEPFGIDECWLDVTASGRLFGDGFSMAESIRRRIKKELGVTISAGVSFNRIFAKFGSDYKKPDAITVIGRQDVKNIIWPQRVGNLMGVGPSTAKRLSDIGIFTVGDLALADSAALKLRFGKNGETLRKWARGETNEILPGFHPLEIPKSIGRSVTCVQDITNRETLWTVLLTLSEDVARQLLEKRLYAGGVQLHLRNCDMVTREFSFTLDTPIRLSDRLARAGMALFDKNCDFSRPLRSAGIRAVMLVPEPDGWQTDIFSDPVREAREAILEAKMFDIRKKYGEKSIVRCCAMQRKENRLCPDYGQAGRPCSFNSGVA